MKTTWVVPCAALLAVTCSALCDTNPDGNKSDRAPIVGSTAATIAVSPTGSSPVSTIPAWTASTTPIHPHKIAGVPNFGKLNDNIWRSGQPTRDGYRLLASQGLKTVVNLRAEFPEDKDLIPQGVQYIYIPIKDEHAPTQEQAQQFINAASNPANWPLLVHCHAGEGRAGTMAALVRCALDKWEDSAVMKETNAFISSKALGLIKPQLASCQRLVIKKWETDVAARPSVDQVAELSALPATASGSAISAAAQDQRAPSTVVPMPGVAAGNGAAARH